ncbi:YlbL family protein [Longispora albida]|uniref:YlbL family protein n=1 Tax=Longispora albida TaxID=203523 RepID=UPI0004768F98|nr:PDZ domain-containing protein [Longispora albida]
MRRRGLTVVVGVVLVAVLTGALLWIKVPYVGLSAGPTVDTLGVHDNSSVITVSERDSFTPKGQLRLTTVGVSPGISLLDAIYYWFDDDTAVVPRDLVYPPDKSQKQVDQENVEQFQRSQTSAETAALKKLGYPVFVSVKDVTAGKPADGKLKSGDLITTVDGQPVKDIATTVKTIRSKPAGSAFTIGYTRGGTPATVSVTSQANEKNEPAIGVALDTIQPHPFKVTVKLDKIGGPSAGLMFSLGILAKLDNKDLTGGHIIAGTGTIDDDGKVGPIGGVAHKIDGAKRDKAKFFLTPADNCAEAVRNAVPGLPLVKVSTLDDALEALAAIREGRQPVLCTAGSAK